MLAKSRVYFMKKLKKLRHNWLVGGGAVKNSKLQMEKCTLKFVKQRGSVYVCVCAFK